MLTDLSWIDIKPRGGLFWALQLSLESHKGGESVDQLNDCQVLRRDFFRLLGVNYLSKRYNFL